MIVSMFAAVPFTVSAGDPGWYKTDLADLEDGDMVIITVINFGGHVQAMMKSISPKDGGCDRPAEKMAKLYMSNATAPSISKEKMSTAPPVRFAPQ